MQVNNFPELFEWCYQHMGLIGWPALICFAWKASAYFSVARDQIVKTVTQIDTMATNHFPHMAESLKTQDGLLHSMDVSLKTIAERTPEQIRVARAGKRRS
jgi:hypothetical protein